MRKLFRRHTVHRIFTREVEMLRRLLVGMGVGPAEGEDLLQDVYQEALKHPPEDRGEVSLPCPIGLNG